MPYACSTIKKWITFTYLDICNYHIHIFSARMNYRKKLFPLANHTKSPFHGLFVACPKKTHQKTKPIMRRRKNKQLFWLKFAS